MSTIGSVEYQILVSARKLLRQRYRVLREGDFISQLANTGSSIPAFPMPLQFEGDQG